MITRWSTGTPEANMDEEILIGLRDIVARHPWWVSRAAIVVALLEQLKVMPPATVLEAGCGWGINLSALETAGYRVTGLDVSRRALDRLDRSRPPTRRSGSFSGVADPSADRMKACWPLMSSSI